MVSNSTRVSFTTVPVGKPKNDKAYQEKQVPINDAPFQLLRNEKQGEKNSTARQSVIHTLHQAPQRDDKSPIIAIVNRFPHVPPHESNLHFMIAPNSEKFHTLESINPELLNPMSKTALEFLKKAPVGALVLTHETDHDMVDSPKRTHKSWKQIHWHFRHTHEDTTKEVLAKDDDLKPYGERLLELFEKEKPLGKGFDSKSSGFDLILTLAFPEKAEDLTRSLKILDRWLRNTQPLIALEQKDQIKDEEFMHKPIHTIAMRKNLAGDLEIGLMPHIKSPNFTLEADGKTFNGVTVEPFANALTRVPVDDSSSDILRVNNSIDTISQLKQLLKAVQ